MCNDSGGVELELGVLVSSEPSALLIGPLATLIQDFTYPSPDGSKDFLITALQTNQGLDKDFVKNLFLHSLPHMVTGYLLLLAAVITLIVFLLAVCKKSCSNYHGTTRCCEICFFFEGLLFVIASAILLFAVVSQLQTAVRLDGVLHTLPAQATTALVGLATLRSNLYRSVEELCLDHSRSLNFTLRSVADLPIETTRLATEVMGSLATKSQQLSSEIRHILQADTNAADVLVKAGSVLSNATAVTNRVHRELAALASRVRNDTQLSLETRLTLASAIDAAQEAESIDLVVSLPDWVSESAAMSAMVNTYLPAITASTHFEQHVPAMLLPRLESLVLSANEAGVAVNKTAKDVAAASEALLPTWWISELATMLQTWQKVVHSLDVSRPIEFSGRSVLVLVPGVHGILTLLIIAIAAAVSVVEIRRHRVISSPLFLKSGRSLGACLLWASGMFGASLLWLHLVLAGGGQLLSCVGTTACRPVLDLRIFHDLLDNAEVWGGMTYLDTKLAGLVSTDKPNGTRMLHLLENCRQRQNLLSALGIYLGPALSKELESVAPVVNASLLEQALDEGLLLVEWPNGKQVDGLQALVQQTNNSINLTIIAQVTTRVVNLMAANMTGRHLRPLLLALPRDSSYDYIQEVVHRVIGDITFLDKSLLPDLHVTMEQLTKLQRALTMSMRNLRGLSAIARDLSVLLHRDVRVQARTLARGCAARVNERMRDWRKSVVPAISTEQGSCRAIYDAYVVVAQGLCGEGLTVANAVWVTHTLMAVALMAIMLLSCHLGVCLRGARVRYLRTRLRLQSKISEQSMHEVPRGTSMHEIMEPTELST